MDRNEASRRYWPGADHEIVHHELDVRRGLGLAPQH